MFGIGIQELAIIAVVGLLIFGPKRLPELAKTIGKGLAEFRRASYDLRRSINMDADPPPPGKTDPVQDPRLSREPEGRPDQVVDAPDGEAPEAAKSKQKLDPQAPPATKETEGD